MTIDLHGVHPSAIIPTGLLSNLVKQVWEMGEPELKLIHGHGRNRGISPGFVNTNTGNFGLRIRHAFRHDKSLRQWIYHTTMDCREWGSTWVKLKPNPSPTRTEIEWPPEDWE